MLKKRLTVELGEEAMTALQTAKEAVDACAELLAEVLDLQKQVLDKVHGEIVLVLGELLQDENVQVVYADQQLQESVEALAPLKHGPRSSKRPELPETMANQAEFDSAPADQRKRDTPFSRTPRHVQVEWLKEVMSDGEWVAAIGLAREYCDGERTFRYLRGAFSGRLREMHEEGIVERRDSHTKGSMFEYRLKEGAA